MYLGGKITANTAADMLAGITVPGGKELTDADLVSVEGVDGRLLRIELPETDEATRQQVIFGDADFLRNFGAGTQKAVLRFYYTGREDLHYAVQFLYANDSLYSEITSGNIKPGYNEIVINNLYAYSWAKTGALKNMRLLLGSAAAANSDLHFGGATVYYI